MGLATEVALSRCGDVARLGAMARRLREIAVPIVLVSILAGGGAGATALEPPWPTVARRGPCTGASAWRLRVVALPTAELRVRFTIAGGAAGETWNLFLDSDGVGFFAGSRVSGVGGLVTVRRRIVDSATEELIRATAHDVATGEICRGRVRARTST